MRRKKANGEKLRDLREDLWLSQGELGEKAGVALHTINRIENGRTPYPQSATLKSIAKVLGVDPHDLLEGESNRPLGASPDGSPKELAQELIHGGLDANLNRTPRGSATHHFGAAFLHHP